MQVVGGMTLVSRAFLQASLAEQTLQIDPRIADVLTVVSTDDDEIAKHVSELECYVVQRAHKGDGPMLPVLLEAAEQAWLGNGEANDLVVCAHPTSPLRYSSDIVACVGHQLELDAGSVVSIDANTGERNSAVYVTRLGLLLAGYICDKWSGRTMMAHERSIDVNTPSDLEEARRILGP